MKRPNLNDPQDKRDYIENLYEQRGLMNFKVRNGADLKSIYGIDINKITGFNNLSQEDQSLAGSLICDYFNSFGLMARENISPKKIETENSRNRFKLTFKAKTYSYLYRNGSIG